ncbi:MAG: methyltransferase domain-containing protein [Flammeovirgaceae bacterium]
MIDRIKRKLHFLTLQLQVKSFSKFRKELSLRQLSISDLADNKRKLQPYYSEYVNHISSPEMAASLELAGFMYTLCKANQYKKVLDMGSGLSSFIFRLYAKETLGVEVYSVDDDAAWLTKTRGYLEQHHLDTNNMFTLQQFVDLKESGFDCILHDMNFVEVRIQYVDFVFRSAKKNGLIIMDDVHKMDYRFALLKKLKPLEASCFTLRDITKDNFGRFAYAVLKK